MPTGGGNVLSPYHTVLIQATMGGGGPPSSDEPPWQPGDGKPPWAGGPRVASGGQMKALAFFMHIKDLLQDIKTPEEWASVLEAIKECEAILAAGKSEAASGSAPASGSSPHRSTTAAHEVKK